MFVSIHHVICAAESMKSCYPVTRDLELTVKVGKIYKTMFFVFRLFHIKMKVKKSLIRSNQMKIA